MIYRSNLTAPDLQPHFRHAHCRVMGHSFGHDVLSDWADKRADDPVFGLYKNCGFWTHDEAAILFNSAKQIGGHWLDIGAHTGWTSAHISAAGPTVVSLDPMFPVDEFKRRFWENICACDPRTNLPNGNCRVVISAWTSAVFFAAIGPDSKFDGIVIDGAHDDPIPLEDARGSLTHLRDRGVILFHDAIGEPVQKGVRWLISQGFSHKIYYTPHVVIACWRGDFTPPEHQPDPKVRASVRRYVKEIA